MGKISVYFCDIKHLIQNKGAVNVPYYNYVLFKNFTQH